MWIRMGRRHTANGYRTSRRRQRATQYYSRPSLIEELADLLIVALVGVGRQFARLGRCLLRSSAPPEATRTRPRVKKSWAGWDKRSRQNRINETLSQWAQRAPVPFETREQSCSQPMPYRAAQCLLSKGERALWYP